MRVELNNGNFILTMFCFPSFGGRPIEGRGQFIFMSPLPNTAL